MIVEQHESPINDNCFSPLTGFIGLVCPQPGDYVRIYVSDEFQSPDGDSLDWYSLDVLAQGELNSGNKFQSPDGDSLDWYRSCLR